MKRLLVAGIGNIFFGDDAFGVEVAKALMQRPQREGVRVAEFGIRGYDLAYAMMEDYEAVILIDAMPRGEAPGTLFVVNPDVASLDTSPLEPDAHNMNPMRVLQMVRSLGGAAKPVFVVGCEPAVLETENGEFGLSPSVRAAIPPAIDLVEALIRDL